MVILTRILQLLIALFLLRLVLRAIFGARRGAPKAGGRSGPRPQERLGGTLVRCDHCRTARPEPNMIAVGPLHFCSADCRAAHDAAQRKAG